MIPLSPLQLKQHLFTVVNVRANPDGKPNGPVRLDQHVVHLPVSGEQNQWQLEIFLNHRSADPKHLFCYEVELHVVGIVEMSDEVAKEKREIIAAVNGLGLLYGAAREMVLNIAARGPHGPFCLAALNFAEVLKQAKPGPLPLTAWTEPATVPVP
jgi:preprotein translocase subunit SecB